VVLRRRHYSDLNPAIVFRVFTRKDAIESVAEGKTVKAHRRGNCCRPKFAPEAGSSALFEPETRDAKESLAEETAAYSGTDLIVFGRPRGLSGYLPERAPYEGVGQSLPIIQTGGSRESVVHRSLIGMPKLIDRELVTVNVPASVQVAFDRREIDIVIAAAVVGAVEKIQQEIEADNLQRWDKVALLYSPRRRRGSEIEVRSGRRSRAGILR
jgi:hypothetical protein